LIVFPFEVAVVEVLEDLGILELTSQLRLLKYLQPFVSPNVGEELNDEFLLGSRIGFLVDIVLRLLNFFLGFIVVSLLRCGFFFIFFGVEVVDDFLLDDVEVVDGWLVGLNDNDSDGAEEGFGFEAVVLDQVVVEKADKSEEGSEHADHLLFVEPPGGDN
jgi:hypothetical protein